jgi:hypothetical protein
MPPQPTYTKLTPRSRSLGGHTQLWLAPDHILLLTSTRFSEDYKRFSISDIQSIVVTELPPRLALPIVMILAALVWISLSFAVDSRSAKWFFEITGVLALLWPFVDLARGPRCRSYLHTRVSRELLEPVNRMRTARRFLGVVRPIVEAVQGALPAGGIAATKIFSPSSEPPPPQLVSSPGYLPEIVFGLFIINAFLIWSAVHISKMQEIPSLLLSTLPVEVLLVVVAILLRKGRDARTVTFVVLALAVIGIGFDFVTIVRELGGWVIAIQDKAKSGDKSLPLVKLFPLSGARTTIAYSWRAAAGVIGLVAAFWERRPNIKK